MNEIMSHFAQEEADFQRLLINASAKVTQLKSEALVKMQSQHCPQHTEVSLERGGLALLPSPPGTQRSFLVTYRHEGACDLVRSSFLEKLILILFVLNALKHLLGLQYS